MSLHSLPTHWPALLIFVITYAGVAIGGIPGLALDRTGVALLGAIAMVAAGCVTLADAFALIDADTIILIYALMVLSAQFRLAGAYTRVVLWLRGFSTRPALFLGLVMASAAALSAVLVNDVICLAFAPILTVSTIQSGLNPLPFLLGLAIASNIGSAATIIGNPQNMLLGQIGRLDFGHFLAWCAPPSLLALLAAYGWLLFLYRGRLQRPHIAENIAFLEEKWPDFNPHQSQKAIVAAAILMGLFFTRLPRELTALTVAGVLLCSRRMHTREILGLIDWHLIIMFCGLFVITGVFEKTGLPLALVQSISSSGGNLQNPFVWSALTAVLSNVVSNVPAVMLLAKFLSVGSTQSWYITALASTYAGNLFTIGSIANLIVIEQAQRYGIKISFGTYAAAGMPATLLSFLILAGWIYLRS